MRYVNVTVQNISATQTSELMTTEVWTASQTTEEMSKQPLSGEIAYQEYGISDAGVVYLFCTTEGASTAAQEGGRLVDSAGTYDIYRVESWRNHYEIIARPVVS